MEIYCQNCGELCDSEGTQVDLWSGVVTCISCYGSDAYLDDFILDDLFANEWPQDDDEEEE